MSLSFKWQIALFSRNSCIFPKNQKLFGKMARFSPFFWKSDFSKILNFFFSFGGRLRIMFHASENYF